MEYKTLAAVDLGSNSFKLQIARVVGDQLYLLDAIKEPVRLAAGLTQSRELDDDSRSRAVDCLKRFGDRLRHYPQGTVRAVGTSALRLAQDTGNFLVEAEAALGFPIEIIAGREEARLIYVGVAHSLPAYPGRRLVVDIGGGSTECIVGQGLEPQRMESLHMGCVNFSLKYFADGRIDRATLREAELDARNRAQIIAADYAGTWGEAIGSSGTAKALADILEMSALSESGITSEGLDRLRSLLIKAGHIDNLQLPGLRPDRKPVIVGGFAIMAGIFAELGIERMQTAQGALREGLLYDLLGRFHHADMRESTVEAFMRRYQIDHAQAQRVESFAEQMLDMMAPGLSGDVMDAYRFLRWAARLHEIGISIAHSGYHKHGAYILENADMPGFSQRDQERLARLVRAQRGSLSKIPEFLSTPGNSADDRLLVQALRLAVAFNRGRRELAWPPSVRLDCGTRSCKLSLGRDWLEAHPLVETELASESADWAACGIDFRLKVLEA
jgi:exopolyphosphatase/guanosine-5'-triphosphate,3'-diphosphate pyrophosphatase